MPRGSPELTRRRRQEIVDACRDLYRTRSFKEISLKEIGGHTTCTRTCIYNYFQTKEEIFLAMFEGEYGLWTASLEKILAHDAPLSAKELASKLALSVSRRALLLKLLSMNLYDMEENSRPGMLASLKVVFGRSMELVGRILEKFCPWMDADGREEFLYVFFPFMYGIYPYAVVTDRQRRAIAEAGIQYAFPTIHGLTLSCLRRLLNVK